MQGGEAAPRPRKGAGKDRPDLPEPLFPKLTPRRNASPQAVAAHQRARLHAALIEACARHGYAATTSRELAALAGVSTKALYSHFPSKEECFLATYDLVVEQAIGRISAAYRARSDGAAPDWAGGLCRAFDAFAAELVESPDPSRLALIEILGAGPVALARIERAEALFTTMIASSFAQAPDQVAVPPRIIRPLVGGIWFLARSRLREGNPRALAASGAELRDWLLAYRSPAAAALPSVRPRPRPAGGEPRVDPSAAARTRMLGAAAAAVARGGYAALSPGEVAAAAGVSEAEFTAHFEDARACFLDLLEWLTAQALAEALRESDGAPTWAGAVCRAIEALFCRLAADVALARAAFLDCFAAGPRAAERLAAIVRAFADLLARRAPASERPSPLVAEAIVGSVWSVAHRLIARGRQQSLPAASARAAFLALAPIIGPEEALAVIIGELGSGARPRPAVAVS